MIREKIDEFMYDVFGEYVHEKDRIDNEKNKYDEIVVESIFPNEQAMNELLETARKLRC